MRQFVLVTTFALISASAAFAQTGFEISAGIGYTLSEGVDVNDIEGPDGLIYNKVDPESGFSYNVGFGIQPNHMLEIGFLMASELSNLKVSGPRGSKESVDLTLNNYHGYFAYNFGYPGAQIRPFFLFGLGATHYITGEYDGTAVDNSTRFSTTWAGGVKWYSKGPLGARFMGRWTPTYIKTDEYGWWCDYWGCYVVGNAEYSHQFEMSAAALYRF